MRYSLSLRRALAGSLLAALGITAAFALSVPPTFGPRSFSSQQVAYFRIHAKYNAINGQACVLVSNSCTVLIGALPYNAYVIRATQQIVTNFNSGTTDTLALGVTSTSANELVAAESVHSGAGDQASLTVASSGSGIQKTGNTASPTGADGGFGLYVKYAQTGAAPTAGEAVIILEYVPANDGDCTAVPIGSTSGAC